MSRHCAVGECSNGDYRLQQWEKALCEIHQTQQHMYCGCPSPSPFTLNPFPTKKKGAEKRDIWIKMVNRTVEKKKISFWTPGPQARVCSEHFEKGCDYPILKLGYPEKQARARLQRLLPVRPGEKRRSNYRSEATVQELKGIVPSVPDGRE